MLSPEELQKLQDAKIGETFGETPVSSTPSPYKSLSEELGADPTVVATQEKNKSFLDKTIDVAKNVGGAIISSEKNFADSMSAAATNVLPEDWTGVAQMKEANAARQKTIDNAIIGMGKARAAGKDDSNFRKILSDTLNTPITTIEDLYPAVKKSNLEVAGEAGGVLLDILSAGSYGTAAKGAKTGELLTSAANKTAINMAEQQTIKDIATRTGKTIAQVTAEEAMKKVVPTVGGAAVKAIAKETGQRMAVGAGTGYAYDVSNNLQEGKTGIDAAKPGMGTLLGGTIPALVGVYKGTKAVTKTLAPKFVNSLIKPKTADFSYGKDPGKVVSELGITGNNLDDFGNKVTQVRKDIGTMLSGSYQHATDQGIKIDLTDEVNSLDQAMVEAAKGGKSNQGVVTALQNAKDALLFDHTIDANGVITKTGTTPKNISALTPNEAFDLKKLVSDQTKFTGNPSDDKTVNMALKKVFGGVKDKLNNAVSGVSPEIVDLNEKYGSLLSAEIAIANREAILKKSNMVSFPVKTGAAAAAGIMAAFTGGASVLLTVLAGLGAAGVEKTLESTAVRTRMAKFLGSTSPSVLTKFFTENPGIKEAIYRAIPKEASLIDKSN